MEECIFDYMALHFERRFNKNSLLQCYFLAILPAGLSYLPTSSTIQNKSSFSYQMLIDSQSDYKLVIKTTQIIVHGSP